MTMKYSKQILFILSILAALILAISGCSEKSLKGNIKQNEPPVVTWASVGGDSLNHVNPVLFWFSGDNDGVVLDRLYSVMLGSRVDSLGGVGAILQNFPADVNWTIVHYDSATIPLIASPDTSVYIDQYIFVKVMDDDSAFSNIIYKEKARNNHRPTCYVVVPTVGTITSPRPDPQWCLPETTSTFQGVRVAWVGKDSIDIPGIQPDFDWNIRLYGPFQDSLSCDTLPGDLYIEYHNPLDPSSVWIRDKEKYLINLETGWYVLYARNRDDALTPSIPALGYLVIYEPTWIRHPENTKRILLANHSFYAIHDPRRGTSGELETIYSDSVRDFYTQMIETYLVENGYSADDYDWVDFTTLQPYGELSVNKSDLYNHRLVIILDTDMTKPLVEAPNLKQESPYSEYMDVGGMVWLIGRRSFDGAFGGTINFGPTSGHTIAYSYFDLSSAYSQSMTAYNQAEFTGARSIINGFPDLSVDPAKIAMSDWYVVRNGETTFYNYTDGLIGVDYLSRLDNSETIYKFVAINPDTSRFHNFPVGVRYDRGTFKTSYFTFPLFFIQRDEAMTVTREMLDWFFNGI
jgi:hypothetical protein